MDNQLRIQQEVGKVLLKCSTRQVVSTLKSLAGLKTQFSELSKEFQVNVESAVSQMLLHARCKDLMSLVES